MNRKRKRTSRCHCFHGSAGILRRRRGASIGVIGGSDGPTAVFVARRRSPRQVHGRLSVQPALDAVLAALRTCTAILLTLSVIVAAANHLYGRNH